MSAYHRRAGEDRVTEVLATVLAGAPGLTNALAERIGMPAAERFAIATQQPVGPDCIIDLEIRASTETGAALWLVWSEHKLEAPFREGQLAKYAAAIRDEADAAFKLIAITLKQPNAVVLQEADRHDIALLRWSDVIALAQGAGVALRGRAWRTTSCTECDDEIARRLLGEWLDFCDYDDVMETPVEPLTPDAVEMLPAAEQVMLTVDRLTEGRSAPRALHSMPAQSRNATITSLRTRRPIVG